MNKLKKYGVFLLAIIALFAVGAFYYRGAIDKALAGTFPATICDASPQRATTTLRFMTPGVGMTTTNCNTATVDEIYVDAILAASSTLSDLRVRVERSMNQVDYFLDLNPMSFATTTLGTMDAAELRLRYATSTAGNSYVFGAGQSLSQAVFVHFKVPTLGADYTRISIFLDPASTHNASIWHRATLKEIKFR